VLFKLAVDREGSDIERLITMLSLAFVKVIFIVF